MSKSVTQQHQTADRVSEQTPDLSTHDITMSAAGRAIRDLISIDARNGGELPLTFAEIVQVQRLVEEDTTHACNEVQG